MMNNKSLSGYRVLDLTRVLAGPWSTQNLADLGADVIKIERPKEGDETRGWGPPWINSTDGERKDSAYYGSTNRSKKSITIDFSKKEGQDLIKELVKKCDVLVENFRVGTLKKYGLSYEEIRKINPKIVYCSVTGFGQTGPYAHKPGYDFVFQAMSGLMSITGERDDLPGGGPQKVGIAITDITTGMYATIAILAALLWREKSGKGQYIDVSLLDSALALTTNQSTNYMASGTLPKRYGNAHSNAVPYQVFDTKDGQIVIAVGNDSLFSNFCKAIDRYDLYENPSFQNVSGRIVNRDVLIDTIIKIIEKETTSYWFDKFNQYDVPFSPINNIDEALKDVQAVHRESQVNIQIDDDLFFKTMANPIKFSETKIDYLVPPPTLGQHTEEVLADLLNLDSAEIAYLKRENLI